MTDAPGVQRAGAVVAALDLLHARERDADHVALDVATALEHTAGCSDVVTATHAATLGDVRHVVITVAAAGLSPDTMWTLLAARLPADGTAGLLMGGTYAGRPELLAGLKAVLADHTTFRGGRVVAFPGHRDLIGTVSAAAVRATAIDDIAVLAGDPPPDGTPVVTRDFVRPRWRHGRLVLDAQPARGGTLVPFETPNPTPCCVDHA